MRVLVGCEFSGVVREAFCALGHDAMSCDLLPTEIRRWYDGNTGYMSSVELSVGQLLDEVGRLRAQDEAKSNAILDLYARVDALRQIVEAVASSNPYGSWYPATNAPAGVVCRWCMERARSPRECQHDHECTWRQARAFLAAHPAAGQAAASEEPGQPVLRVVVSYACDRDDHEHCNALASGCMCSCHAPQPPAESGEGE